MSPQELAALVGGGESEGVEFKATTGQRLEAARTVCGMLNGRGGFVLFGVRDDGTVVGQQIGARTLEEVVESVRRIEPFVLLAPERVPLEGGREVIVLRVPGGLPGPFALEGRPYVRQGPTTTVMPQEQYRRLLLEQMHAGSRWENQPARELDIGDLDRSEITRTVDEAIRRGRMEDPGTRGTLELLRGLGMIADGSIVNAAVALFGGPDRFLPHYPQCLLRMARFRGTTTAEFEDNRQVHGNAFELLIHAQRFLREHLPVAGRIVPGLFDRTDDPLYPPEALREALANALCHRDYAVGGSVSLAIFDDRLEIASTGTLHFGLAIEDLSKPHASRPWNPLIASVFYRRGLIEQWGRGTLRITELTERAGLRKPEFEERAGELVVRFFPSSYVAPRRIEHSLTELQQRVLEALGREGSASLAHLVSVLGDTAPRRLIQRDLSTLREFGLVTSSGYARGARWRLTD
jgi:ATP-dependent DNA helicase RecG